jgi:hypothetical protein
MSRTRPFSYITFVLRLWPANGPDGRWQAHLENPRTGERHGFTNPQELVAFLGQAEGGCVQDVPDGTEGTAVDLS